MRIWTGVVLAGVLVLSASRVGAQHLEITVKNGQVTMDARDVPVQRALAELARLGGVTVVGIERISAPPVSLLLNAVPERDAFRILLRGVDGYVLAARPEGAHGNSAFDRVLILAGGRIGSVASRLQESAEEDDVEPAEDEDGEPVEEEAEEEEVVAAPASPVEQAPVTVSSPPPLADLGNRTPGTTSRPAGGTRLPTFPVPAGSGRPGVLIPAPGNPYGPDTASLSQPVPPTGEQPR